MGVAAPETPRLAARDLIQVPLRSGQVCFNFGSLASYWPRPWSDFGVPLGAGRPPKGGPETSKRQPQTTQTASLECLWGAFGAGPPEGGRELQGDNPGDPKWASRRRGAQFVFKRPKMMSISLRRNVHAVDARSPYWSKEGAGRARITTACRKIQTYAKTHVVENVHAVEARSPF